MFKELKAFFNQAPEIVFTWQDPETEAEGWLVIDSLRNGAAGGSLIMDKSCSREEVVAKAKAMAIRYEVSGPKIGGAKAGIRFDPEDSRREGVLKRWFCAIGPLLKSYYGWADDLRIDHSFEIRPVWDNIGLGHPAAGMVSGYLQANTRQRKVILDRLDRGFSLTPAGFGIDDQFRGKLSDMATGFGVAEAVRHYYDIWERPTENKRVIIQGFGRVGGAAALTLSNHGYRIVGVIDHSGGIIQPQGISADQLRHMYCNRDEEDFALDQILSYEQVNTAIWSCGAEVFIPAAGSQLISKYKLDELLENGLEVIACGAFSPFKDIDAFIGETGIYADNKVVVIPDFIANSGLSRVFAYLMEPGAKVKPEAIFADISQHIAEALQKTHARNPLHKAIWQSSISWVLQELMKPEVAALEK